MADALSIFDKKIFRNFAKMIRDRDDEVRAYYFKFLFRESAKCDEMLVSIKQIRNGITSYGIYTPEHISRSRPIRMLYIVHISALSDDASSSVFQKSRTRDITIAIFRNIFRKRKL